MTTPAAAREQKLKIVRSKLGELSSRTEEREPPPTADEVLAHLESLQAGLVAGDRRAGVILRKPLDGSIRAIPHQQFGSDKVVLRAEFDLVLTRSLPAVVAECMAGESQPAPQDAQLHQQRVAVDLFKPSDVVRYAVEAHALAETGLTLVKVGKALGISKRQARLCGQLGAKLAEAGVTYPFIQLSERPAHVSRRRMQKKPPGERGSRDAD